ncbi:MAG: PKD domain-containing protein [Bacteroidota bacterium]|nr:PKD domain-containing protein [Bacteroidota bacterium]
MKKLYILLLCLFNVYFSGAQTYTMPTGTGNSNISTCSGTFYDSGGAGGTYATNSNSTITFCPGTPGQFIRIVFSNYNAENLTDGATLYDYMEIFNGPTTASPLMTTLATDFAAPITFESSDPSGCITFHFVSDGFVEQAGWSAAISCFLPCSPPTANITTTGNPPSPLKVCPGTTVNFSGSASTAQGGFTLVNYDWDFGDNTTATGVNTSHTFNDIGVYVVELDVTDNNGCVNNNLEQYSIWVSPPTFFNGTAALDNSICLGESTTINGVPTPQTYQEQPTVFTPATLYLPDGDNAGYDVAIPFDNFATGATLTNVNDLLNIFANIEHSYLGDLVISIVCPNGQNVTMHNADGTFDAANSQFLGNAIAATGTGPGVGFDYSWQPTGNTYGTMAAEGLAGASPLPAGSYTSEEALNGLVGCPLNGNWTMHIEDTEPIDDGYIFDWGINFNPSLYQLATLTPVGVTNVWSADPTVTGTAGNNITVQPGATGNFTYTFNSTNDYGCPYDTTITITVNPLPVSNAGTNNTVCSGVNYPVGAAAVVGQSYSWNPATNLTSGTAANPTFNATNAGPGTVSYTYTLTTTIIATGCQDTDQVVINVAPNPTLTVNSPTICSGTANLIASGATTYVWSAGATATSPSGDLADASPVTTTQYTVTGTIGTCTATAVSTVTVVNSVVAPTTNPVTYCLNDVAVDLTATADPGGTLNWYGTDAVGGTASPTAPIPSTAVATNTTYYVSQTIGGCEGPRAPLVVTVNPLPTFTPPANATYCEGANVPVANLTSTPAGASFAWTNTNTLIGLAANGTVNIPAFTATNGTSSAINGVVAITPTLLGCVGATQSYTITIDPLPVLTAVPSETVCANVAFAAVNFSSTPTGASVNWTNSNAGIGIGVSGNSDIASFNGINAGAAAISGNFSVTPTLSGCVGLPITFTLTVDPIPTLTAVPSETVCAGDNTTAINFTTNPATTPVVSWTNTNGLIGVGSSGSGNIASFAGVNGSAITVTGDFSATATLNGCTSLPQTFTITVNPMPVLNPIGSQTVCAGAVTNALNFTYVPAGSTVNWTNSDATIGVGAIGSGNIPSFNGINAGLVSVTGNFSATATLNGCTSTPETFLITVDPSPTLAVVPSETVCAGASTTAITFTQAPAAATVNWTNSDGTIGIVTTGSGNIASFVGVNGGLTTVSGNFSATATLNGCTSAPQTFTITINPMPTLPAITSQSVCAGNTTTAIGFIPSPAASTVNWTNSDASIGIGAAGSGNIAPFTGVNAGITVITGDFSATATLNNCTSTPQLFSVTINPLPTPAASNLGNPFYCVNGTFTLDVNPVGGIGPYSYSWTGPLSYSSIAQTNTVTLISVPMSGNYTVVVTDINSCVGQSTTNVVVNPLPIITASNNGPLCVGQNLILSCTPGSFYSWSGPNGYNSTLANPTIPSVTTGDAAMYSVIVTDANGCQGPAFTPVVVNTNPTPVASNNGPVCLNTTLTLSLDQVYASYSWTGPNVFVSSSASPSINNITNASSGIYDITVTDANGCTGTASTTASINQLPTAALNSINPGCAPICRDFYLASSSNLIGYSWSLGNGFVSGNDTILQHCYESPGTYPVSCFVTDINGCSDTIHFASINVYEVPEPQFTFGPSEVTILEPEINFVNQSIGSNIVSYAWEFGDPYHNTSGLVNPTFTYSDVGTYDVTLTVTNNYGCIDSITHPVTIPEGWAIYVPNAFSPNEDGFNDSFYPQGVGIDEKNFQMWIFDRWGNQIFYTTSWDQHWDGKVAGHDNIVQQDTYIWKINAKSFKGDKFNEVGHVHVVR